MNNNKVIFEKFIELTDNKILSIKNDILDNKVLKIYFEINSEELEDRYCLYLNVYYNREYEEYKDLYLLESNNKEMINEYIEKLIEILDTDIDIREL